MPTFNGELIFKILAIIVGIFGSIYQLRNLRLTFRSSLKTDLEILKMVEKDDPSYEIIRKGIHESIKQIYGDPSKKRFKIYNPADFYMGFLFMFGFSYWSYFLTKTDHTFWAFVVGFFALAGFGGVLTGVSSKENNQKANSNTPPSNSKRM